MLTAQAQARLLADEAFPKSDEHLANFDRISRERFVFREGDETAVECALNVVLELRHRSDRLRNEVCEVLVGRPAPTLGDTRGD